MHGLAFICIVFVLEYPSVVESDDFLASMWNGVVDEGRFPGTQSATVKFDTCDKYAQIKL